MKTFFSVIAKNKTADQGGFLIWLLTLLTIGLSIGSFVLAKKTNPVVYAATTYSVTNQSSVQTVASTDQLQSTDGEVLAESTGGIKSGKKNYKKLDPQKVDYDFNLLPQNWHGQACLVKQRDKDTPDSLDVGLKLLPCTSSEINPNYTCQSSQNYTAGYAWTACVKELPLLNYFAAQNPTDDNNFLTDCQFDGFKNIVETGSINFLKGDKQKIKINFANQFPGMAMLTGSKANANLKVPRLGGAAACAAVNWDDDVYKLQLSPELVGIRYDTGGYTYGIEDGQQDNLLAQLLSLLKELFKNPTITKAKCTLEDYDDGKCKTNEVIVTEPVCSDIGGGITKLNVSDTAVFDFAENKGICEQVVDAGNYELTKNEVCDKQFLNKGSKVKGISGAECRLEDPDDFTFTEGNFKETLLEAGLLKRVIYNGRRVCETKVPGNRNGRYCGQQWDCEDKISELYKKCRGNGMDVVEISGEPIVDWERDNWQDLQIKNVDRTLESAWYNEVINSPYEIVHENVGIRATACFSTYDLNQVVEDISHKADELKLLSQYTSENIDTSFNPAEYDYESDQFIQNLKKLDPNLLGNSTVKYVGIDPVAYNPNYSGGFKPADNGTNRVCLDYYYPYIGQVPRIFERITYFLTNQLERDTFLPFCTDNNANSPICKLIEEDGGSVYDWVKKLDTKKLEYLEIPIGQDEEEDCTRNNCDHFAKEGEIDPLRSYLQDRGLMPAIMDPGYCVDTGSSGGGGSGGGGGGGGGDDYGLVAPVNNVRVTQCYGPTKDGEGDPKLIKDCLDLFGLGLSGIYYEGWGWFHRGIDLGPPNPGQTGYPIFSAGEGSVVSAGWNNFGFGNYVVIQHTNGLFTSYAHLASISVSSGKAVTKDTKIGVMGTTGNSTGIHLHFQLMKSNSTAAHMNPNGVILNKYSRGGSALNQTDVGSSLVSLSTKSDGPSVLGASNAIFPTNGTSEDLKEFAQNLATRSTINGVASKLPQYLDANKLKGSVYSSSDSECNTYNPPTIACTSKIVSDGFVTERLIFHEIMHIVRGDNGTKLLPGDNNASSELQATLLEGLYFPGLNSTYYFYDQNGAERKATEILLTAKNGGATDQELWDFAIGKSDTLQKYISSIVTNGEKSTDIYCKGIKVLGSDTVLQTNVDCSNPSGSGTEPPPGPIPDPGTDPVDADGSPLIDTKSCSVIGNIDNNPGGPTAENLKCLIRQAVQAVNEQYGERITEEMIYAIGLQETGWTCTVKWEDFPDGTVCTGDPNQEAFITDNMLNDKNGNGVIDPGEPNVRGVTQFTATTFNSLISAHSAEMKTCTEAIGVDTSFSPDPYSNTEYSRHRVGDMICATLLKNAEDARSANGGNYVKLDGWTDPIISKVAERYYGACIDGYCESVIGFFHGAESIFDDLVCEPVITGQTLYKKRKIYSV